MEPKEEKHHVQQQLCTNRPAYRQGRKLTAVKVYTINNESAHLFVYGVPSINLRSELKTLCTKYGQVLSIHVVQGYKTEQFTECYHVQYERIQSARIAKRLIDTRSFYGGLLHVCYAPEYESLEETRAKLAQRDKDVLSRLPRQHVEGNTATYVPPKKKRKLNEPTKKFERFPDIYQENDPILKKSLGPVLPENHQKNKDKEPPIVNLAINEPKREKICKTNFIPSQVKRIIFNKRKKT